MITVTITIEANDVNVNVAQQLLDSVRNITATSVSTDASPNDERRPEVAEAVERMPTARQADVAAFIEYEQIEHGARAESAKNGPQVRLHAPSSRTRGAYAVVHPSRVVLKLPAEIADEFEHTARLSTTTPYQVAVYTARGDAAVKEAHELARRAISYCR